MRMEQASEIIDRLGAGAALVMERRFWLLIDSDYGLQ